MNEIKVLFDHQCFVQQQFGGVSRYHYHLIRELNRMKNVEAKLSLKYSNNFYINEDKTFKVNRFFPGKKLYFKRTILDYLNRYVTNHELKRGAFNLFHPTYYNPYFLKLLGGKPFVVTVYDMIHEIYPEISNAIDKTLIYKKEIIARASVIIAISESTKADLMRLYKVPAEKIEVVYLASSINKDMSSENIRKKLPRKYLLYVGNRNFYKNFKTLLLAIENVLRTDKDLFLIIAGGEKISPEELKLFSEKDIQNKVIHFPADDFTLATLYTNAIAFVFPSLYEGFGIPALEAMNCDCPVIMSNRSSLPEVGGDAALYFDPENIDDIREKILLLISDTELRQQQIKRSINQREKFSYSKTAFETLNIYEKLLNR